MEVVFVSSKREGGRKRFAAGTTVHILAAMLLTGATGWPGYAQTTSRHAGNTAVSGRDVSHSAEVWWKHAVIYEIYPRSFQDSNGDGVGDLNGIAQRLDYLKDLGVDAIWIAPMYPSPQVDFGYDISDYESIDPQYGTLADFDRLVNEAKRRHIRILLDMVLNHTSDRHQWFLESASSRTNPKHDWYIWNDGKPKSAGTPYELKNEHNGMVPPNNWISIFGGPAWEWNPAIKQFYYHAFYKQQPDLNWRNPAVEDAMFGSMKFWLNRGVAGFRLDAITLLFEDAQLRDDPELGGTTSHGDPKEGRDYTDFLPEVHDVLRRMRTMTDRYAGNRLLIGETYLSSTSQLDTWYGGEARNELQLPMDLLLGFGGNDLNADRFRRNLTELNSQIHGSWPLLVFDNHDKPRSWGRFGDGVHDLAIAKAVATVLLTTRSTPLMYYGEELGMTTTDPTRIEDVKDPIGIVGWPANKGRDGERTPMQWDDSNPQAGFSAASRTWLPVASNYSQVNVKTETADPGSLLNWYKQLIHLRRSNGALHDGAIAMLDENDKDVLIYLRSAPSGESVLVAVNMSPTTQTRTIELPGKFRGKRAVHSLAASDRSLTTLSSLESVTLPPYASWVASVK